MTMPRRPWRASILAPGNGPSPRTASTGSAATIGGRCGSDDRDLREKGPADANAGGAKSREETPKRAVAELLPRHRSLDDRAMVNAPERYLSELAHTVPDF